MESKMKPLHFNCNDLTDQKILEIEALIEKIWPQEVLKADDKTKIKYFREHNRSAEVFLVYKGGLLTGHTKIFARTILTDTHFIEVTALSGVAVLPEFRNYGLGKLMVNEVFELIKQNKRPVCLFQTTIPGFYEKLDARIITNRFFNSKDPTHPLVNPWGDPYVMIFPEYASWPDGDLDLNGPAF
jgi:ribosomal protein S18 acetylase RimI-like enzyme